MMMKKPSTKRTSRAPEILRVIQDFFLEHGYTPTIREIGQRVKIRSTSHVKYYLDQLCDQGVIARDPSISRGIRLLQQLQPFMPGPIAVRRVPFLGRIQAGEAIPIPASDFSLFDEESSTLEVPESMLDKLPGGIYALEVKGDSMRDMLINDGDIIILRHTDQAQNGQIVAAWLKADGGKTTLKKYYFENGHVRLQPANPEYQPIYAAPGEVEIQGQVVMLIRNYLL